MTDLSIHEVASVTVYDVQKLKVTGTFMRELVIKAHDGSVLRVTMFSENAAELCIMREQTDPSLRCPVQSFTFPYVG